MDELTLRRAQQGDSAAFEALVTPEEQHIWRICWRYTRSEADAADCLQETMIRAWRGLGSYRGDAAWSTWLHRIAVNSCLDFLRNRSRRPAESLDALRSAGYDPPSGAPGPEETVLNREEREQTARALADLPETMRETVILCVLEDRTYEETAGLMQTNVGTVKSRLSRARDKLSKSLGRNARNKIDSLASNQMNGKGGAGDGR